MDEFLLKEIYKEVISIREKVEAIEEAIIPKEKISQEEIFELERLKKESIEGEHIEWDELRKELEL